MENSLDNNLLLAIQEGKVDIVRSLLQNIPLDLTTNRPKNQGESFLHYAAYHGKTQIVELLLKYFDVNSLAQQRDDKSKTALVLAIERNHVETVKLLLNHEADMTVPSSFTYYKLFQRACFKKREEMVKILLERGIRLHLTREQLENRCRIMDKICWGTIMYKLMFSDRMELLKLILNYKDTHKTGNHHIFEACLACCVQNQDFTRTSTILSYSTVNKGNRTFVLSKVLADLHACTTLEIVQLLLDHGANPYYFGFGAGAIDAAVSKGNHEVVQLFLDNGVDPNATNPSGFTPLSNAIEWRQKEILRMFLDNGGDINVETRTGRRQYLRLHVFRPFFKLEHLEISKILVEHVVELQSKGMFVEQDHLKAIAGDKDLTSYKKQCEEEIKSMKSEKIVDSYVTLHDVWTASSLTQLSSYLRNKNVKECINFALFEKKFPIYFDKMRGKIEAGLDRISLEAKVYNFFFALSTRHEDSLPKLPVYCVYYIITCLRNKDLINLTTKSC